MLTAQRITAITLALKDGDQAVLVQVGKPWNGLHQFNCIAPARLEDRTVIATRNTEGSKMNEVFNTIFRLDENEAWTVVMASPALHAELKLAPESSTPEAPATRQAK